MMSTEPQNERVGFMLASTTSLSVDKTLFWDPDIMIESRSQNVQLAPEMIGIEKKANSGLTYYLNCAYIDFYLLFTCVLLRITKVYS